VEGFNGLYNNIIFIIMSIYKIKLEDKAAFLNRLDKQDIAVDSYKIQDNKLGGYFEMNVQNPEADNIIKTLLKQSPKINKLKEMTKSQLTKIIKEELGKSKTQPINEDLLSAALPIIGTLLGVGATLAAAFARDLSKAKTPEEKAQVLKNAANQLSQTHHSI
jgi:hypothetical protein